MGQEIERKFLVSGDGWRDAGHTVLLRQGYLSSNPDRVVRVRIEDDTAMLTIKSANVGATRGEWEYPIPVADAQEFLSRLCEQPVIDKTRTRIVLGGVTWEVDEFLGVNAGLIVAEIELDSEQQDFVRPDWLGQEVTGDKRYYNSALIQHPHQQW